MELITIFSAHPNLNWHSTGGICCSGCLPTSVKYEWVASLVQTFPQQKISAVIEPTLNLTGCIFSLGLLYPCCVLGDADAIEISLERVGDRIFFLFRRKFMFYESNVYDLKGVTSILLKDSYDPEGPNVGVQLNLVVEHESGSATIHLPHPYRKSFFTYFTEFQAIASDIINGTHILEPITVSSVTPIIRNSTFVRNSTSSNNSANSINTMNTNNSINANNCINTSVGNFNL
jgi:hypothetical protein